MRQKGFTLIELMIVVA
ncbi:MAG TPA: hypothetical protein DIC24_09050, partial [Gammaproteobacteria bacterium]|nr:hypothetical protein [Gammaproteobacteria bacterium]